MVNVGRYSVDRAIVTTTLNALGLPNYDQAARILPVHMDSQSKVTRTFSFATSVRGAGTAAGHIITVTYQGRLSTTAIPDYQDGAGAQLPDTTTYGTDLSGRLVRGYERTNPGAPAPNRQPNAGVGGAASVAGEHDWTQTAITQYQIVESSDNTSDAARIGRANGCFSSSGDYLAWGPQHTAGQPGRDHRRWRNAGGRSNPILRRKRQTPREREYAIVCHIRQHPVRVKYRIA